jgi:hypothetical protein
LQRVTGVFFSGWLELLESEEEGSEEEEEEKKEIEDDERLEV